MSNMPRSLGQRLHGLLERGDYALIARDGVWSFGTERAIKSEREPYPLACETRLSNVIEKARFRAKNCRYVTDSRFV